MAGPAPEPTRPTRTGGTERPSSGHAGLFTEARAVRVAKAMVIALVLAAMASFIVMRDMMIDADRGLGGDFLAVYAAGVLAREGRPETAYDLATIVATEHRVMPQVTYVLPWPYPPVFQMVAMALAKLPYVWAYGVWALLLLALYVAMWRAAFGGGSAPFWLAMGSSTTYMNIVYGQNGLLNATLVGAGLLVLRTRPLLAGMAIGALCYKPQIGLPIGILLLATGQWRAVFGAALSVSLLCGASLALLGPDVWIAFINNAESTRALLEYRELPLAKLGTIFSVARMLGLAPAPAYVLQGIVAIAALALAVRAWRLGVEWEPKLAVMAATVPLVPPYLFDYDFTVLLLPIGWLLVDGFRHGWLPGMRTVLTLAWFAPTVSFTIASATHVQILPFTSLALFWMAWRRCIYGAAKRPFPA